MKARLLIYVSVAALVASSFVARADDLEAYQSALSKLAATPEEARSAETKQDIQKLQALVQQQIELKKNNDLAQQAEQQLPTLRQQYQAAQPAYDAQATEVAKALDRLDALNKMYSGQSTAQVKLTQAIKDQQAAEKKVQSMSPSDPNYAAALKDMATKQYLAGVAADVVKDPKNGLAKLQSAQQDYNEAKARLDKGEVARHPDDLATARARAAGELAQLSVRTRRFMNPQPYPVGLDDHVHERKLALIAEARNA